MTAVDGKAVLSRADASERLRVASKATECPGIVVLRSTRSVRLQCGRVGQPVAGRELLEEAAQTQPTVEISGPADLVESGEYPYPLGESLAGVVAGALVGPQSRKETFCFYRSPGDVEVQCGDFVRLERQRERTNYVVFIRTTRPACFLSQAAKGTMRVGAVSNEGLAEVEAADASAIVRVGDRLGPECTEVTAVDYLKACIELRGGGRICAGRPPGAVRAVADGG